MRSAHCLATAALVLTACSGSVEDAKPDSAVKAVTPTENAKPVAAKAETAVTPADAKAKTAKPDAAATAGGALIDHQVTTIDGQVASLGDYRGKAMLIVNTASQCGFTPQYAGLQELYGRYKDKGLVVLGFPSNDFGSQEPGTAEEIKQFVSSKYAVEFPMFDKVVTKGSEQAPLYSTLTTETGEGISGQVQWNFTKFLVDPEGHVVDRFDSGVKPMSDEIVAAVEKVLPKAP